MNLLEIFIIRYSEAKNKNALTKIILLNTRDGNNRIPFNFTEFSNKRNTFSKLSVIVTWLYQQIGINSLIYRFISQNC